MRIVLLLAALFSGLPGRASQSPTVEELNREGVRHYDAREYHQAIGRFRAALRLDPGSPELRANLAGAWSGLGVEFLNSGESAAAIRAFEESLELHEDFYARFGLGYIHFLAREDDRAREQLTASLRLRPDFGKTHKFLAMIDYRGGREKDAITAMDRAGALDPEDRETVAILQRWKTEARVVSNFRSLESSRFRIRYDPAISRLAVQRLHEHLEAALDAIGERLGHRQGKPGKKLSVGLFGQKSFHEATGTHHWIGGLFDGQIKIPMDIAGTSTASSGAAVSAAAEVYRALRHELTHALVKELYPACPNWLNEGIAQSLEYLPVTVPAAGGGRAVGKTVGRDGRKSTGRGRVVPGALSETEAARLRAARGRQVRERLRRGVARRVPFARIPVRLWELSDEAEARWTYLQGLGFVDYLVDNYQMFRLQLLLQSARTEGSIGAAFELTYGKKLAVLEAEWWQFVEGAGS